MAGALMDRSRVLVLLILALLPLGALEARLLQLQILDPGEYVGDLTSRRSTVDLARARRGRILDRHGRVLAEDQRCFDAYLVLEEYEKSPWPLETLLPLSADEARQEIEDIYARIERQLHRRPPHERRRLYARERRTPYLLCRDVSFESALAIETAPRRFPGVLIKESLKRVYPFKSVASHVVGYLGRVTANEKEFQDLLQDGYFYEGFQEIIGSDGIVQLYRRGAFHEELIGRAGIERSYDARLRGRSGLVVIERDPATGHKNVIELKPAEAGEDVELTLDAELQAHVEAVLAGPLHAAAVVLEPETGGVLALASNRGFDPNDFSPPGNAAAIRRVLGDADGKPLQSRAFAQQYQLGSIFKVVTSAAGLEEGKVRAEELLPCRGKFDERLARFNCWIWNEFRGMHHELTLHEALERSCNCYYYELGRRCGMETVAKWARALGFGAPTGLDLPGEAAGRVPDRARWENDVLSFAIGQHELMVTPIQAAVLLAAIANGGRIVTPHLRRAETPAPRPSGLSPTTIQEIRRGLYDVVHAPQGTAHRTELKRFAAAGKTSTAQAGGGRTHAWFGGYAPHDAPRYVVVVFVENGGHGGEAAGPPAARILERLLKPPRDAQAQ
jgi:penicillin-binding protein 2